MKDMTVSHTPYIVDNALLHDQVAEKNAMATLNFDNKRKAEEDAASLIASEGAKTRKLRTGGLSQQQREDLAAKIELAANDIRKAIDAGAGDKYAAGMELAELNLKKLANNLLIDASTASSEESLREMHYRIIMAMDSEYLAIFFQAVDKVNEFLTAFNGIQELLASCIESVGDRGDIKFNVKKLVDGIKEAIDKFGPPKGVLFPVTDADDTADNFPKTSEEEADNWRKQMGLPASCLKTDGNGGYWVAIDLSPLENISNSLNALAGNQNPLPTDMTISSAEYSAWNAGFNTRGEEIKSSVQVLLQKMQNAKSLYDNAVGILSKFIEKEKEVGLSIVGNFK